MMKVSMIGLTVINLKYLKVKQQRNPNMSPTRIETTPSMRNCPAIINGVVDVNVADWRLLTVLKRMIETMSLKTPSPKMHE